VPSAAPCAHRGVGVDVSATRRRGGEHERDRPPSAFAFFADDGRRTADVITETDARVLSMFGTHFREMEQALPEVEASLKDLTAERSADPP
jgi:hypothetical protein